MTDALFPYQEEGAQRLAERTKLYLGDDVGLGKTRTVLRGAILAGAERVVVLTKAAVVAHWHAEAAVVGFQGRLTVCSYERYVLHEYPFEGDVLVLDEGHLLKHADSRRSHLILKPDGLASRFLRVWPVSGTPMPRNPMELHAVAASLWPRRLEAMGVLDAGAWLNRFCVWRAGDYGPRIFGAKNVPELKDLLAAIMLRRRATDLGLAAPVWGTVMLSATDLAGLPHLNADVRAALERGELPPMSPNLARYLHAVGDLKAPLIAGLLTDELDNDLTAKRVVFAHHRSVLQALAVQLAKFEPVQIDGSVPDDQRRERVKLFQQHPSCRVFLGQLEACATGMDGLQYAGCHDVALVEPAWSSDTNVQAVGRLARRGQPLTVRARMFGLAGTPDAALVTNHYREAAMRKLVLGD